MSRLAELIQELCPDGVEYRCLGDLGDFVRGGGLQKADFVGTGMPCVHYGQIHTRFGISTSEAVSSVSEAKFARLKHADYGDLLIATTSEDDEAVGKATAWLGEGEVAISGDMFYYRHNLEPKYVSYFFASSSFQDQKRPYLTGAKVRRIADKGLSRIQIPVPPLDVQREIVRLLDQFTTLEAELEAELEARRTQYEHYRNHLLSYESLAARGQVEVVKLGELAHIATGGRNTSDAVEDGAYPFYVRSQVPLSLNEYDFDESAVLTAGDGVGVGRVFHHVEGKYALHQRAYRIVPNLELLSSKYLYHVMVSQFGRYLESTVFHSSVTSVRKPMLERFPVAVPPMEEQDRVADVLDRFDALVNDITSGLPAEIAARRAQCEHYRDRLLSFPEKAVSGSDAS